MIRHQSHQEDTNRTGLLQVPEADVGDEFHDGNHDSEGLGRTPPRPKWGLLYAVLPLTLLLFALADLVPQTSGWRIFTETIAVLVVFGMLGAWVRLNRSALALSQEKPEAPSDTDPHSRRDL